MNILSPRKDDGGTREEERTYDDGRARGTGGGVETVRVVGDRISGIQLSILLPRASVRSPHFLPSPVLPLVVYIPTTSPCCFRILRLIRDPL